MKPENDSGKWQWIDEEEVGTKHHDVLCSKHFQKNASQIAPCWAFSLGSNTCPQVTDLERFSVRISKDEAPTPLPVVSPLSFHLSRALLGAWRCGLFRSVYSSFHNRLDHIREPAFYWVFYFIFSFPSWVFYFISPVYPFNQNKQNLFIFTYDETSYVKMNKFCSFWFNRLAISWPPWVMVWGWAGSCHWLFFLFQLLLFLGLYYSFTMYEWGG